MLYVPFIYFLLLFLFIYKKRGMDASAYITLLYVITSFFSILLMNSKELKLDSRYITLLPTVIYCLLITLFILPIYNFNTKKINRTSIGSFKFVKWITYFYFGVFFLILIFYFQDLIRCLVLSNLKDAKDLIKVDGLNLTEYPLFLEIFLYVARMFSPFSLVLLFVFFYSVSFLNKSGKFNAMILIGSLSGILMGILNYDRSKVIYWIMMFGLCAVMFWDHLNKKRKKSIKIALVIILSLMFTYFAIITIGRWGDESGGATQSIMTYAGQPYLNFCYFFSVFDNLDGVTLKYLFPAFHHFILGDFDGSLALQEEMSTRTGIFTGVFYSMLGDFLVSDGKLGPFIFTLAYLFISSIVLRRNGSNCSFERYFTSFFVMLIPTVGIIAYYYANFVMTVSLLVVLLLMRLMNRRRKVTSR